MIPHNGKFTIFRPNEQEMAQWRDDKIGSIKALRLRTGAGLAEAKFSLEFFNGVDRSITFESRLRIENNKIEAILEYTNHGD